MNARKCGDDWHILLVAPSADPASDIGGMSMNRHDTAYHEASHAVAYTLDNFFEVQSVELKEELVDGDVN